MRCLRASSWEIMRSCGWAFLGSQGCLSLVVQLVELCFHCGVTSGEFFNRDVLSLVVGEAKVAVGAEERVFGLLQVGDRLVDFFDRGLEHLACVATIRKSH